MPEENQNPQSYNPDILDCLSNLSNDEVFTPPRIVNAMLDLLPQELFQSKETKFLDPFCKSGVFLREIAKRLIEGLQDEIKDLQERLDHIFKNQLYGIAITEMTSLLSRRSLYCSKYPNSRYSITKFKNVSGNIRFKSIQHTWEDGKCKFCGASQEQFERGEELESHAYEFIHTTEPKKILNMNFDVIIGNPPYQLSTGGSKAQAIPLYDKFVEKSKKLNPKYLSMIIPSRWFAGGMGLDDFRDQMMKDTHIKYIVDYTNAKDCFSGQSISGGVCYFLWDRNYEGKCEFTNINNGKADTANRYLNEFTVLVRYNKAVEIINKIKTESFKSLGSIVSSLMPYGLSTNYRGNLERNSDKELTLYASDGITYVNPEIIKKGNDTIQKYKILISKTSAEHAGEPGKDGKFRILTSTIKVINPGEVCTHSYFTIGSYDNIEEAKNTLIYLKTKFVRFLILQAMSSINLSKLVFPFVPMQDFSKPWTDEELYKKYKLTKDEIDFIESMIKPMDSKEEEVSDA